MFAERSEKKIEILFIKILTATNRCKKVTRFTYKRDRDLVYKDTDSYQ